MASHIAPVTGYVILADTMNRGYNSRIMSHILYWWHHTVWHCEFSGCIHITTLCIRVSVRR